MIELSIEERAVEEAHFIIETKSTLREAEKYFGISRSTISRDIVRLMKIDYALAAKATEVLNENKADSRRRANEVRILKARSKK